MSDLRRTVRTAARDGSGNVEVLPQTEDLRPEARYRTTSAGVPVWKRLVDLAIVFFAVPVLAPLILLIAAYIKLSSRGPVLFRQERVGFQQRKFMLYKFRTMTDGTDRSVHEDYVDSLIASDKPMTKLDARGDERLIPLGRWIRASGLDEIPQLINVIRGEMSLVGPRPCLPGEFVKYLPWQHERFETLPGLTGLWQVSGKNRLSFTEMVRYDIEYVRTCSIWMDLWIFTKTLPAILGELRDMRMQRKHAAASDNGDGRA